MSPLEFGREIEAWDDAQREREERLTRGEVAIAWHTVALQNELHATRRLPDLRDVVARMTPRKNEPVNLAAQLDALSKQYGIPVQPMSPEAHAALQKLTVRMNG